MLIRTRFLCVLLVPLLCACGTNSSARANIVAWAQKVATIQRAAKQQAADADALHQEIESRGVTQADCLALTDVSNKSNNSYNEFVTINPPEEGASSLP